MEHMHIHNGFLNCRLEIQGITKVMWFVLCITFSLKAPTLLYTFNCNHTELLKKPLSL